jgi:hypothetical protein
MAQACENSAGERRALEQGLELAFAPLERQGAQILAIELEPGSVN